MLCDLQMSAHDKFISVCALTTTATHRKHSPQSDYPDPSLLMRLSNAHLHVQRERQRSCCCRAQLAAQPEHRQMACWSFLQLNTMSRAGDESSML